MQLILKLQPIPIRFAQHYLRLIDLPSIPVGATRAEVLALFGEPESTGGGIHPQFGFIPDWIRFAFPEFLFRCEFEADTIANIAFMPRTELPAL
jgi:hypothetical protein